MRRAALAGLLAALAGPVGPAAAHVAPSVQDNNRYLELTLLGDRIRLLYTVYLGEIPGAQARRRMDADGDGALSEAEARSFGVEIGAAVAGALVVEVDGARRPVTWDRVDVGLGMPVVAAGAFAIDLVAWLPLASPRTRSAHDLWLLDPWVPPTPGESEIRVEESPGVRAVRSTVGRDGVASQLRLAWTGTESPIAERGLYVEMVVDPAVAPMQAAPPARAGGARWASYAGAAAAAIALAVAAVWLVARKNRA